MSVQYQSQILTEVGEKCTSCRSAQNANSPQTLACLFSLKSKQGAKQTHTFFPDFCHSLEFILTPILLQLHCLLFSSFSMAPCCSSLLCLCEDRPPLKPGHFVSHSASAFLHPGHFVLSCPEMKCRPPPPGFLQLLSKSILGTPCLFLQHPEPAVIKI